MSQTKSMIVSTAILTASTRIQITPRELTTRMMRTDWGSVSFLYDREFNRVYRGYYPTCGMHNAQEAVVAEVFDALARQTDDPRRAKRYTQKVSSS